jgi:hypothetical protein
MSDCGCNDTDLSPELLCALDTAKPFQAQDGSVELLGIAAGVCVRTDQTAWTGTGSSTIAVTPGGVDGHAPTISTIIASTAGNQIQATPAGLFVPAAGAGLQLDDVNNVPLASGDNVVRNIVNPATNAPYPTNGAGSIPVCQTVQALAQANARFGVAFAGFDVVYCDTLGNPRIRPTRSEPQLVALPQQLASAGVGGTIGAGGNVASPTGVTTIVNPHVDKSLLCVLIGGLVGTESLNNQNVAAGPPSAFWSHAYRLYVGVGGPPPAVGAGFVSSKVISGFGRFVGTNIGPLNQEFSMLIGNSVPQQQFVIPPSGSVTVQTRANIENVGAIAHTSTGTGAWAARTNVSVLCIPSAAP